MDKILELGGYITYSIVISFEDVSKADMNYFVDAGEGGRGEGESVVTGEG